MSDSRSRKLDEFKRASRSLGDRCAIYATTIPTADAKAVVELHSRLDKEGQNTLMDMSVSDAAKTARSLKRK